MKIIGIIPARMGSTRFPGKPLTRIRGITMIEHVYRRSQMAASLSELCVATCDAEIADEVRRFGGRVAMTSSVHTRCTDRIAEAAQHLSGEVVVNIQGDEPLVRPEMLDAVAQPLVKDPTLPCSTLIRLIEDEASLNNPNVVKVVFDKRGHALYFSREAIPSAKMGQKKSAYKQIGILAFRRDYLLEFARLPETPLEQAESVDLMRAVENAHPVQTVPSPFESFGVDRPQDVGGIEAILDHDPLFARYAGASKV